MNDPNKAINVNLSSLLSLKAELLRKQAEVSRAKSTRSVAEEYSTVVNKNNRPNIKSKDEAKIIKKSADGSKVYEHDDSALLEKSKKVLEAKSKYYERMSRAGGTLNSDDNCLVLFNRKQQDEKPSIFNKTHEEYKASDSSESDNDAADEHYTAHTDDDSEDWVEYTDCLGRTRKCLKKDLDSAKKRDAELAASMPERLDQTKALWWIDTKKQNKINDEDDTDVLIGPSAPTESIYSDGCSLMSKHDEQRLNWEKKEQENLEKPEVHYQDVFFDEARQHGVGYYAFSTDEEERKRQQQELEEARLKTKEEQARRDALRAQREHIIKERVLAAKNRQRARLGLPPITADEFEKETQATAKIENETKEERKARKRAEKLKRQQEVEEAEREKQREAHIRPWDQDKEGVKIDGIESKSNSSTAGFIAGETEWTYKPERVPLSQEEWNERKRAERNPDFAPVPDKEIKVKRKHFASSLHMREQDIMPPPLSSSFLSNIEDNSFASFQSTKCQKTFQRRNYKADEEQAVDDRSGAAIPPPSNLDSDYTLPPHAKRSKGNGELERSIEAGLRYLRNNSDKGNLSTKSSWTAKADYE